MRHRLATVMLLASAPCGALACSCVPPGTVQDEMASSTRVFLGRVTSIEERTPGTGNNWLGPVVEWIKRLLGAAPLSTGREVPYLQIGFAVSQTFKGSPGTSVRLATGMGGGDCGYGFAFGQEYVVYAHGDDGSLQAGICSLTGPASEPRSGLAILRNVD